MKQKATFKKLFAGAAMLLAVLPVVVTFSSVITSIFNKIGAYVWLQNTLVPFEAKLVAVLIRLVGIKGMVTPGQSFAMLLEQECGYLPISLEWKCLGWQSMILLGLTLLTGPRGNWKLLSKAEAVINRCSRNFFVKPFQNGFYNLFGLLLEQRCRHDNP